MKKVAPALPRAPVHRSGEQPRPDLSAVLERGGLKLTAVDVSGDAPTIVQPEVVTSHRKALATLLPEPSALLHAYAEKITSVANGYGAQRAMLLRELAAHGVVINDPGCQRRFATRTVNGLIHNAARKLEVWVDELKSPETARKLVERAGPASR